MKTKALLFLLVPVCVVMFVAIHSCKKEVPTPTPPAPHNPYTDIHRDDSTSHDIPLDSLTITYIHKKVLSTRCALNGCHDGHFEPDYRTPQSSFSTLVYASIVKNNTAHQYAYRVIPYDTANSVLYQRITNCCFVNTNDRMPQDNIGVPLPDSSISLIAKWIMHGARDMFGNVAHKPNLEPVIQGYFPLDLSYHGVYTNHLDSIAYNPFILPDTVSSFYIAVQVTDDSTPISQLIHNKLKISIHENDFSQAWEFPGTYISSGTTQVYLMTVNTAQMPLNDTLFMRFYTNDGNHPNDTEAPRSDMAFYYRYYWSFIRQ